MTAMVPRETERQASAWRFILLHPGVILLAVWGVALTAWWRAPDDVLATSVSGLRAGSLHAAMFFAGCLGLFVIGSVAGGLLFQGRSFRRIEKGSSASHLWLAARVIAGLTVFGFVVWLTRIAMIVGGLPALLHLFLSGDSVAVLKSHVYTPAQLPLITTMVHLAPAAASVLLIHRRRAGGWTRFEFLLFAAVLVVAGVRALAMAERLAALGVLSAVVMTLLLTAETVKVRRVLLVGAGCLLLAWLAWSAGEFSRSWMDSRKGPEAELTFENFKSSLSYSQTRFQAYLFTAINNGVIIVDEWPSQEFPQHFAPVASRVPGVGADSALSSLYEGRQLNREFTGLSMPGTFYLDAREMGVVLALAYGLVLGAVWRLAALGHAAGVMLYASLIQVVLDSYRSAYLFDLQGMAGFAAAAMVLVLAGVSVRDRRGKMAPDLNAQAASA